MNIEHVTTKQQLEDAYSVRKKVFVEEQNVSIEEEMDEFDEVATHFAGYAEGAPVSASRLRFVEEYAKLERICILKTFRGEGYGKQMILHMEEYAKEKGYKKSKLNAQIQALGFYESLGYKVVSEEFMDAGIPHVTMIKEL
ncbi:MULTISPECIES: GNAT family N-acetyltransferase [Pontibacillus]|uniref:GNAT family N-acetyltransferase n=1 Tax=Pontibacillus chungwhensis TaxID=265426 RepID=A0ABY8V0M7_9BACI|nr:MULTISPECIES: GNAT family N-acetyltransferase [Pontibacillus]MCD5324652.1 GNAT family N-acetyltransferase [Pontibacillus sp. HN14]WIF99053.1 GNAT family N-acetyltransferase [Pontibacillus chungwhensis]